MNSLCDDLPEQISSFVDTFVDFVVGGVFLNRTHQDKHQEESPIRTTYPQPDRLVAVGDVHGDLLKAKQSLRLAKIIDENDAWIGGDATVVQVGDILDRGDDELKTLYFFEKLKQEASKSGGRVLVMNGNHEIMNISKDFRYVTRKGFTEFENWALWFRLGIRMKNLCKSSPSNDLDLFDGIPTNLKDYIRARVAALRPGGPISSRFLARNPTVLVVGDSVFAHGGLLPGHVKYGLEKINSEVGEWINGKEGDSIPPSYMRSKNSIVWLRRFSTESVKDNECLILQHALETIPNAKRMIVGHTIQESGINGACQNRVIRIDVGMSKGCGNGMPEVLEIRGNNEVRILTSNPLYDQERKEEKSGLGLLVPDEASRKEVEVIG